MADWGHNTMVLEEITIEHVVLGLRLVAHLQFISSETGLLPLYGAETTLTTEVDIVEPQMVEINGIYQRIERAVREHK